MDKYKYGADFTARERKRINDIIYRMRKEGYNVTPETRQHITSSKNVREQVAKHVTFQAVSKRGNRVGPEYSGEQALKLHRLAVKHNREIDRAKKLKKFEGFDLDVYKVNTSLTGLSPSTIHSKKGFMESDEVYKERLKKEGERAVKAAEKAWSKGVQETIETKWQTALNNFMGIIGDEFIGSLSLPEEFRKDIESKLRRMGYKEFTNIMKRITEGEGNIFEWYKGGYEEVENGLRELFRILGYDVEERRSLAGNGFDPKDKTIYLQDIMDMM